MLGIPIGLAVLGAAAHAARSIGHQSQGAQMGVISESIRAFVAGKRVVPPVPPGRTVVLVAEDAAVLSPRRDGTASLSLFIEYVDAKGDRSERRIGCRSYDRSTDIINAWCFERSAVRAFRCDRIASAACTETGELFDLADLIQRLRARGLPVRDAGLNAVLKLLTFLMRCDGVHPDEQLVIEEAITSYALRFDGDDAMVDLALRQARTMAPDEHDFLRALRSITLRRDGPALARFVRSHAQRVIDADGRHSAEEARFGMELDQLLSKVAAKA
jgi:hypothetical protein